MGECIELRKLRKYHELTHQDMAALIGVDVRTYKNKEKGISQFKLDEMVKISRKFGKTIDEIFLPKKFMEHEYNYWKNHVGGKYGTSVNWSSGSCEVAKV